MTALPSLNGSIGYIFTSCDLNVHGSANIPFKDIVERFRVYDRPSRPKAKELLNLAGERIDAHDYLLYGRLYIPTGRLDALFSTRISSTWQLLVAGISERRKRPPPYLSSPEPNVPQTSDLSNVMFSLQHDIGKWCTEYTWSAEDGMLGLRVLHNFGMHGSANHYIPTDPSKISKEKRVDEEEAMEGGLKGRISAGAELYFSAKEKSAGVSTGLRFTTIPDATPVSFQTPSDDASGSTRIPLMAAHSGPPTTVTAIFNPMMGHMSGAYASRVTKDLTLGTRFDFNVYSYESEWTMGLEWWLHRARPDVNQDAKSNPAATEVKTSPPVEGMPWDDEVRGVVKARLSTNTDVALMWEGRLKNMLVGLGVNSDLTSAAKPIRSMGLELAYFSSD